MSPIRRHLISTFSIVARDPNTRDLGVAVASKFLSVVAVVPWAQAEVGAVATQGWANPRYGPLGLASMAQGLSAEAALEALLAGDSQRAHRQVGLTDAEGRATAYTGRECLKWAGHHIGDDYTCQGNILATKAVIGAMAETFAAAKGGLWDRLLAALEAGEGVGGDRRGRQSAALLIVRQGGGYGGLSDRFIDLRADDHPAPIAELDRLLGLHKLYLFPTDPADLLPLNGELIRELQQILRRAGHYEGLISGEYDEATRQAFWDLAGTENLEGRWCREEKIDRVVLELLREKFGGLRK